MTAYQIYYDYDGTPYRKLMRNEEIKEDCKHNFNSGPLMPIVNPDTIGDVPLSFSDLREFFKPIYIK